MSFCHVHPALSCGVFAAPRQLGTLKHDPLSSDVANFGHVFQKETSKGVKVAAGSSVLSCCWTVTALALINKSAAQKSGITKSNIFHTGSACFYLVVRLVRCPLQRWSQQLTKCKEGQENTGPVSRGSCSSLHCQSEHVVKVLWQLGRMAAFYAVNGYTVTYHTTTVVTFEVG